MFAMPRVFIVTMSLGVPALGQPVFVTVSHDDPDGVVEPGQVVQIRATLDWMMFQSQFAGIAGSMGPAQGVGAASSPATTLPGQSSLVNVGVASGAGVFGFDVASIPPFFLGGLTLPVWNNWTINLLEYTWTAPTDYAGPVDFAFTPSALAPHARFYTSLQSPGWVEVPTTYVGTSIIVVPSPPAMAAMVFGFWVANGASQRRR